MKFKADRLRSEQEKGTKQREIELRMKEIEASVSVLSACLCVHCYAERSDNVWRKD